MSPSENDLRASLRSGEGDAVDADRIMAAGAAVRTHRRNRIVGVAAAVVVVAAAGSLTGVVANRDGSSSSDSGSGGARADENQLPGAAPGNAAPGAGAATRTEGASAPSNAAATCPDMFPRRLLPGGGKAGKLFDRPAVSITVCSYGSLLASANGARPTGLTLTGAAATALQSSLENAPTSAGGATCTAVRPANQRNLAFVPVDAAGTAMAVVTTTLSVPICDTRTTNGYTVRFGWVPPVGVRQQLYNLTPDGAPSSLPNRVPSGKNIGSPVR